MNKIFAAVFAAIFFIFSSCAAYAPSGKLFVTMLNIGQGDAFLIETPEQNVLLDTGDFDQRDNLISQLHAAGITHLEKIILTHPHADHIGGVRAVIDNFSVDQILDNGISSRSPFYKDYRTAELHFSNLKSGDVINLGGGVKFKVLNPAPEVVSAVNSRSQRSNANNESIVGKLTFGDFSMLFTGDIEKEIEDELLDCAYSDLQASILKAAHHGSKSSNSADFIHAVNPNFIFISAGKSNRYGHPHKAPLATFRQNFIPTENILCTAFNGFVRVESDGKNLLVFPEIFSDWVEEFSGEIISVTRID